MPLNFFRHPLVSTHIKPAAPPAINGSFTIITQGQQVRSSPVGRSAASIVKGTPMAVDSVSHNLAPSITGAIRQASQSTGISFQYLLTTAKIESNFNPSAKASTSSAKGLYQFIDQTWLGTMKQEGASLGYGKYADAITKNSDGRYTVEDPSARAAIMKLRSDPEVSAMMAGAFSRANAFKLTGSIGRRPTEGELYIAHFLGPDGAGKMINAADSRPNANAAAIFPAAARANRSIFYDSSGSARTVGEVYSRLTGKFDTASTVAIASLPRAAETPAAAVAAATASPLSAFPVAKAEIPSIALSAMPVSANSPVQVPVRAAAKAPDTAGMTQALAEANAKMQAIASARPLFQAMFSDRGDEAISQTVADLWTPGAADQSGAGSGDSRRGRGLDLFSDGATNVRSIFNGKA
jgi:hypothetical protein